MVQLLYKCISSILQDELLSNQSCMLRDANQALSLMICFSRRRTLKYRVFVVKRLRLLSALLSYKSSKYFSIKVYYQSSHENGFLTKNPFPLYLNLFAISISKYVIHKRIYLLQRSQEIYPSIIHLSPLQALFCDIFWLIRTTCRWLTACLLLFILSSHSRSVKNCVV